MCSNYIFFVIKSVSTKFGNKVCVLLLLLLLLLSQIKMVLRGHSTVPYLVNKSGSLDVNVYTQRNLRHYRRHKDAFG